MKPNCNELQNAFARLNNLPLKPTLDHINNPCWKGKNIISTPSVMDRIYIMDTRNYKNLLSAQSFGTEISPENNLAASDHYEVVAELEFTQ